MKMKKISPSKNRRINWGTGVVIGIVAFVVMSITMTIIFMTQDVSLVSDNYYEKSLSYQEEIDKQNRTKLLNEEVEINYNGDVISILFPSDYISEKMNGEMYFYRPSDQKMDFKISLKLSETGTQIIPTQNIEKGFWRLKLNWEMDGNGYYNEKAIIVQ
jgi:hypothetical protein